MTTSGYEQAPLLHIGYPKCLSTWMQKCLFTAQTGLGMATNPFELQLELVSVDPLLFDAAKFRASFYSKHREKFSASSTPVCSSENLVGTVSHAGYNAKYNADKLKASFPDARVLIVIREQKALLRSLYKTLVAWGMPYSIDQLMNPESHWKHMAPSFDPNVLQFDRLIEYYQSLFSTEQVKVLSYEQFRADPRRFVTDIVEFSGVHCDAATIAAIPVHNIVNPGAPLLSIEKHRLTNRLYKNLYNTNGLLRETEARQYARMEAFRKQREGFLDRLAAPYLEQRFARVVNAAADARFAQSNSRTVALTGLDLEQQGYALAH